MEGVIFTWDIASKTKEQEEMTWEEIINPDEIFGGGDFGYSVDPAVFIKIYRKANEFWVEEIVYETGLTNQGLGREMEKKGVDKKLVSYWDSAEPKSIQELTEIGFNAKPCEKGPDSVRAGIDFLLGLKIHIIDGSEGIFREQKSYLRQQDKAGRFISTPINFNNHAMSAIRYGIHTHCKSMAAFSFAGFSKEDWR